MSGYTLTPEQRERARQEAQSMPLPDRQTMRRLVQLLGTAPVGVKR